MSQLLISRVFNFRSATGTPSLRAQVAYITLPETRFSQMLAIIEFFATFPP